MSVNPNPSKHVCFEVYFEPVFEMHLYLFFGSEVYLK